MKQNKKSNFPCNFSTFKFGAGTHHTIQTLLAILMLKFKCTALLIFAGIQFISRFMFPSEKRFLLQAAIKLSSITDKLWLYQGNLDGRGKLNFHLNLFKIRCLLLSITFS